MDLTQESATAQAIAGENLRGSAFDYSALAPASARIAKGAADEIRAKLRTHIHAAIVVGRHLNEVRALLDHGEWAVWLSAELPMITERTAFNYMRAAAVYEGKSEMVSDLPLGILYQLAAKSVPDNVRTGVLERRAAGERLGELEIKAVLADVRWQQKEAARIAEEKERNRKNSKSRSKAARERQAGKAEEVRRRNDLREQREQQAAVEAVEMIARALGPDLPRLQALISGSLWAFFQAIVDAQAITGDEAERIAPLGDRPLDDRVDDIGATP
ncbi:MAG: DUF3102 domain-containing protein [Methylobacteriaceae bacterium]|nr:DUF3102 domain-containing protein [Methylobacteriaceae bacterium]